MKGLHRSLVVLSLIVLGITFILAQAATAAAGMAASDTAAHAAANAAPAAQDAVGAPPRVLPEAPRPAVVATLAPEPAPDEGGTFGEPPQPGQLAGPALSEGVAGEAAERLETIFVPANGSMVVAGTNFAASDYYYLKISGTYIWGGCDPVGCPDGGPDYLRYGDGGYLTDDHWKSVVTSNWSSIIYLTVNGQRVNVGPYRPDHVYYVPFQPTTSQLALKIQDCSGCYGDNQGYLAVELYRGTFHTCGAVSRALQPLMLVPGWGGDNSIDEDEEGFKAIREYLEGEGWVENCNLFYASDTAPDYGWDHNESNARAISDHMRDAYYRVREWNRDWNGHFDIIGHSYGGLNARFYLEEDYANGRSYYVRDHEIVGLKVDNLFTLGSPHGGAIPGAELYPGALYILKDHLLPVSQLNSSFQLLSPMMATYNLTSRQAEDVCYRLIGGNFLIQPATIQHAKKFFLLYNVSPNWRLPNDIGVSQRSSLNLALNPFFYPHVKVYGNTDMHGYVDQHGLGALHSYVHPNDTFKDVIIPIAKHPRQGAGGNEGPCGPEGHAAPLDPSYVAALEAGDVSAEPILVSAGTLAMGQTATLPIKVDEGGSWAFYANAFDGQLGLTLDDPLGKTIDPAVAESDPNIDYLEVGDSDGGMASYVITDTLAGPWSAALTNSTGQSVTYELYAATDSDLVLALDTAETGRANQPLTVAATLSNAGLPLPGAVVSGSIRHPNGTQTALSLRDDGVAPDPQANDGIYTATYTAGDVAGDYGAVIRAAGTVNGRPYERTTQGVLRVATTLVTLGTVQADAAEHQEAGGLYESLAVTVRVAATAPLTTTLSAALETSDGTLIDKAAVTFLAVTGNQNVTLRFSGESIRRLGHNGPYRVTSVRLVDSGMMLTLDELAGVYLTQAYDASQFGVAYSPELPAAIEPPNGEAVVPVGIELTWAGGDLNPYDAVTYDVYLDTVDPPLSRVADDLSETYYQPPVVLQSLTPYYWQIVARDSTGLETVGPVWSFLTEEGLSISSFAPLSGPPVTSVRIFGSRLSGATDVTFNGVAAMSFESISDGEIMARVPVGATTGKIALITPDGLTMGEADFVVVPTESTGTLDRVSVSTTGAEADDLSNGPAISADDRYVVFTSQAANLVPNDTNDANDIFVHDRQSGATTRVSVASNGAQANGYSYEPVVSANGGYIAFMSYATNLVANDTNGRPDIFVRDVQLGVTSRVSLANGTGVQADDYSESPAISADGRYVAFTSSAANLVADDTVVCEGPDESYNCFDIFVHDRETGATTRVSLASDGTKANSDSYSPAISGDGRFVVFISTATNLVPGEANWCNDIFVHDRQTGQTTRVSEAWNGSVADSCHYSPSISADGRFVAFSSYAANLVPGDTNEQDDIFVHDTQTDETNRVSVAADGSELNQGSHSPAISANGRYVSFSTEASALASDDTNQVADVFVHDRQTELTIRVSTATSGLQGDDFSNSQANALSADGQVVVFTSNASTLVADDVNWTEDVFVHDRAVGPAITDFLPTTGPVGTVVTISGTNLAGVTAVTFNGIDAASFTVNSATQITAIVAAGATTGKIAVTTPSGTAESATTFIVILPPTISGFTPTSGLASTSVIISGTAFSGATAVTFNGANAASFTVNSATQITALVPPGATTGKIAVTTPGGTATSEADFTVIPAPTITSFSPTSGSVGTVVTITGTALTGATTVKFNGTAATFTVASATQINATVPAGATTGKIAVTTPGGTATSATDFTVTVSPTPTIYLSPTSTGKLGVKSFTGADILSYVKTTNTWDVFYDGSYIRTAKNIGAFAFQGADILLGFSAAQAITGLGTAAPQDLVRFTPTSVGYNSTAGAFAWFFDGSDVGLTTSAEAIDALWIDASGRLYVSTTGSGSVPVNSAQPTGTKVNFQDEDVLRFTPSSTGATTAGTWALYWDPTTMTGMSAEDINGYWEDPVTGDRFVTILGAFTIGNTTYGRQTGNGKTILRFAPNAAAPGGWAPVEKVTWLATGATFGSNIDGIEMAR